MKGKPEKKKKSEKREIRKKVSERTTPEVETWKLGDCGVLDRRSGMFSCLFIDICVSRFVYRHLCF
jgi:hypothetical protein